MRSSRTRVLPVPAPATTSIGPWTCSTAARCAEFSPASGSLSLAAGALAALILKLSSSCDDKCDSTCPNLGCAVNCGSYVRIIGCRGETCKGGVENEAQTNHSIEPGRHHKKVCK